MLAAVGNTVNTPSERWNHAPRWLNPSSSARSSVSDQRDLSDRSDAESKHYHWLAASVMRAAAIAFGRHGKGIPAEARLNLADCAAYALAITMNAPSLFKGDDFAATDVRASL
jgi:uncharacterized protein with PIN domain